MLTIQRFCSACSFHSENPTRISNTRSSEILWGTEKEGNWRRWRMEINSYSGRWTLLLFTLTVTVSGAPSRMRGSVSAFKLWFFPGGRPQCRWIPSGAWASLSTVQHNSVQRNPSLSTTSNSQCTLFATIPLARKDTLQSVLWWSEDKLRLALLLLRNISCLKASLQYFWPLKAFTNYYSRFRESTSRAAISNSL